MREGEIDIQGGREREGEREGVREGGRERVFKVVYSKTHLV